MSPPAGPIYASSLHRRDRAWGLRRRGMALRLRLVAAAGVVAVAVVLVQHFS